MNKNMSITIDDNDDPTSQKSASISISKTIEAELLPTSLHPYSSVSVSPDHVYAIVASRDVIRMVELLHSYNSTSTSASVEKDGSSSFPIGSSASWPNSSVSMRQIRYQRVAQYFSHGVNSSGAPSSQQYQNSLRDAFSRSAPMSSSQHGRSGARADVTITDVAWGPKLILGKDGMNTTVSNSNDVNSATVGTDTSQQLDVDSINVTVDSASKQCDSIHKSHSLIAASASNGVVVVWQAQQLIQTDTSGNTDQDSNGWKRSNTNAAIGQPEAILNDHSRAVNKLAWHPTRFGILLTASQDSTVKLWDRSAAHEKDVRKLRQSDGLNFRSLFGLSSQSTTQQAEVSSNLDAPAWRCTITITPKSDAIRDIKWSHLNDNIFALVTDSGYLIIYNIRVPGRPWLKVACHSGEATSVDWHPTKPYVLATGSGRERVVKVWDLEDGLEDKRDADDNIKASFSSYRSDGSGEVNSDDNMSVPTRKSLTSVNNQNSVHYHTVGSHIQSPGISGTKPYIKRTMSALVLNHRPSPGKNIHTLHIAAPVTRIKWRPPIKSAGFHGLLTVVGHNSSVDIDPHDAMLFVSTGPSGAGGGNGSLELWSFHRPFLALSRVEGHLSGAVVDFSCLPKAVSDEIGARAFWQYILSVGRDGRCLIQNLATGNRPIESVPKSTFALGTLAPSETLRGSLQVVSVNQSVPSGLENDFYLTRLWDISSYASNGKWRPQPGGQKEPESSPILTSSIIDGYLISSLGISDSLNAIIVAPELQYLSYFARSYKLKKSSLFPSISSLCRHNAEVAGKLEGYGPLARMWMMLSAVVSKNRIGSSRNPLSTVLWSTVVSLLNERAEAGDVQTCVALCEVFDIVEPSQSGSGDITVRAQSLDIETIREWYLSYIDILHTMSLFSLATDLIRSASDPVITALNQQSTMVHECCPECNKPLQPNLQIMQDVSNGKRHTVTTPNLLCLNCRKRIGSCFLCHLPVRNGLFLFCPGCGHGGHVQCASSWFNNGDNRLREELCPTGCGHKCSLKHHMSFPSDATFLCAETVN